MYNKKYISSTQIVYDDIIYPLMHVLYKRATSGNRIFYMYLAAVILLLHARI